MSSHPDGDFSSTSSQNGCGSGASLEKSRGSMWIVLKVTVKVFGRTKYRCSVKHTSSPQMEKKDHARRQTSSLRTNRNITVAFHRQQ